MEIVTNDGDARRALQAELARFHCRVHQPDDPPLFTREPRPQMRSVHWRWRDLAPLLDRLGREVDLGAGGPRRTLRLQNPGLAEGTTHTFWCSIQVILPGEVATCHRHSASALRFIMKGHGAWTTVDGEHYPMDEGDLVLTPAWSWHDHVHRGSEPMVWLDVLDISLMRLLQATFFEPHAQDVQAVDSVPDRTWRQYGSGLMAPPRVPQGPYANPLLAYPQAMAAAALEAAAGLPSDPHDDVVLAYRNPDTGGPAMTTMGQQLQRIRAGFQGRRRRHSGSKVYYVLRGRGVTTVGDERYDWEAGDFFAVAPWAWHAHQGLEDALLFQVNDQPALQALGYYREELE
ncbi:MAG: cupin domain-containing protein [Rubrivivax sp.]